MMRPNAASLPRTILVLAACALSGTACKATGPGALPSADAAALELSLRDGTSGEAVRGRVTVSDAAGRVVSSLEADRAGRVSFRVARGRYHLKAEAPRHEAIKASFDLAAGTTLPVTVWLDPQGAREALTPEPLATQPADKAVLQGYVAEAGSERPLQGALATLERSGGEARTDDKGRFELVLDAPPSSDTELPPADRLIVRLEGHRPFRSGDFFLVAGTTRFLARLERGAETTEAGADRQGHKMLQSPDALVLSQSANPDAPYAPSPPPEASRVPVPGSIRVGLDCQCGACRTVHVFSLETYVRRGLDDEWVASWHDQSLRAGAIAYRSYAVYHVAHPLKPNYDICSTTCCQVLDPTDTHARTDAAAAATAGMIVVNAPGNAPFRAEYGAENNGRHCPDGSTGRPDQDWPCLDDAVDARAAFNGHGRGMCQWGTQRWATRHGKDCCWIVDHYYNENGHPRQARSGILQLPAGRSCPLP
jgi:hypothetical protein